MMKSSEYDAFTGLDAYYAKQKMHHRYGCSNKKFYARLCKNVTCLKCLKILNKFTGGAK